MSPSDTGLNDTPRPDVPRTAEEAASIERSPLRDMEIPDSLPERMSRMLTEVKAIPDVADDYRAAIVDWAHRGADSPFPLPAVEVVARASCSSKPDS